MNKRVIRAIVLSFVLVTLLGTLTGCQKSSKAIDMYVQDYRFAYSLQEVTVAENGNTLVKMLMVPEKNKAGEKADFMQAMQVAQLFLMEAYIVVDGTPLEYLEDVSCDISSDKNNDPVFVYNFEFPTSEQPDELYFFPANKREDASYHWQIDPLNGKILKAAAITEE